MFYFATSLGRLLGIPLVCADKFSLVYGLAFAPSPSAQSYPLRMKSPLSSYCTCFSSVTPWRSICWLLKGRVWKGGYCALMCTLCKALQFPAQHFLQWFVSTTQSYSRSVNSSSENGEHSLEPCAECSVLSWSLQRELLVLPVQGCRARQMYRVDLPVEQAAPLICEMLVWDSGACQERGQSSQLSELPHLN